MRMSVESPTNFQQISGWLHNFQCWMYLPSGSGISADTVTSPSSKTGGATGRASQLWSSGRKCSWPVIFGVSKGILQRAGWRALDSNTYYVHIYINIFISICIDRNRYVYIYIQSVAICRYIICLYIYIYANGCSTTNSPTLRLDK